jgi:hypothetical protein
LIAASLVALTGGASAGPLEAQVGAALVAFDQGHSDDATTIGAGTLTATLHVDPRVPVGLQMHLAVGRDGTGTRALGIIVRRPWGVGSDFGVGIASVTGVGNDMAPSLRTGGIGVSVDARRGFPVGPVTVGVYARYTWVFAIDAPASEGALYSATEAGLGIGYSP